jgi:predicted AAA+ superfamily ATPase
MYNRNILIKLNKLLEYFPAAVVLGVRQAGKSHLVKTIRPDWEYFDLERPAHRDLILSDPELFFRNHPRKVILDEVQLFPEILATLRGVIDEARGERDRFLLTGSSSPELVRHASESLAGRIGIVELSPLKMNEIYGTPLPRFYRLFDSPLDATSCDYLRSLAPERSYKEITNTWLSGGYPEPRSHGDSSFMSAWFENYIRTFVERDLKRLYSRIDSDTYRTFLGVLKDFHGQTINMADIARSLGVREPAVRGYLEIAHHSFLWRMLQSFERSQLRSVTKHPRGFYRDSGIYHYLLGVNSLTALEQSRFRGASFEAFVIEELLRGLQCTEVGEVQAQFFRTRSGSEVDLVLDGKFGTLPIEIKCSSNTTVKDVPGLVDFVKREQCPFGIVINLSESVEQISERVFVVPAGTL